MTQFSDDINEIPAKSVCEGFSEEEKKALYRGLVKLNNFLMTSIEESEEIHRK